MITLIGLFLIYTLQSGKRLHFKQKIFYSKKYCAYKIEGLNISTSNSHTQKILLPHVSEFYIY